MALTNTHSLIQRNLFLYQLRRENINWNRQALISHELVMIFLDFLLDLMRSMTTTSTIAIKIITTMPKAATTPPKTPTFNWVPTKGYKSMHYIIL